MAKKKSQTETGVEKSKGLFDIINGITADQSIEFYDNLSETEKKTYKTSRYMIHRFLSMNVHYAPIINTLQQYSTIPDRAHYLFLTNILPKGKQYSKYIKGDKDEKYEAWLVELLTKHYHISKTEAITYLEIYYRDDKEGLRNLCNMYGIDKAQLKKAKL